MNCAVCSEQATTFGVDVGSCMANGAQSAPGAQSDPFIVSMASLYGLWLGNNGTVIVVPLVAICCSASACTASETPQRNPRTLGRDQTFQGTLLRSGHQRDFSRQLPRLDSSFHARGIGNTRSIHAYRDQIIGSLRHGAQNKSAVAAAAVRIRILSIPVVASFCSNATTTLPPDSGCPVLELTTVPLIVLPDRRNQPGMDDWVELILTIGSRQDGRTHVEIQIDIRLIAGVEGDTAVDDVVGRQFDSLARGCAEAPNHAGCCRSAPGNSHTRRRTRCSKHWKPANPARERYVPAGNLPPSLLAPRQAKPGSSCCWLGPSDHLLRCRGKSRRQIDKARIVRGGISIGARLYVRDGDVDMGERAAGALHAAGSLITMETAAPLSNRRVTGSVTGEVPVWRGGEGGPAFDGAPPAHPKETRQSTSTTHPVGIQGRIDSPIRL